MPCNGTNFTLTSPAPLKRNRITDTERGVGIQRRACPLWFCSRLWQVRECQPSPTLNAEYNVIFHSHLLNPESRILPNTNLKSTKVECQLQAKTYRTRIKEFVTHTSIAFKRFYLRQRNTLMSPECPQNRTPNPGYYKRGLSASGDRFGYGWLWLMCWGKDLVELGVKCDAVILDSQEGVGRGWVLGVGWVIRGGLLTIDGPFWQQRILWY